MSGSLPWVGAARFLWARRAAAGDVSSTRSKIAIRYPVHIDLRTAVMGAAIVLLVGCGTRGERIMARAERTDSCGANPVRDLVGRLADPGTRATIEQRVRDRRRIRWVVLGEDMLADLSPGRITILLNEDGTIRSIGCF